MNFALLSALELYWSVVSGSTFDVQLSRKERENENELSLRWLLFKFLVVFDSFFECYHDFDRFIIILIPVWEYE